MMRRQFFISFLGVAALVMGGAALWQTRALGQRNSIIAELRNFLTEADRAAGVVGLEKHALEVDMQQARAALKNAGDPEALEDLRAKLAAAQQQLSAAETAMVETENRLAEEISASAALKRKSEGLAEQLAAAWREVEAAEAKAERAQTELAKLNALLPATQVKPENRPPAETSATTSTEAPSAAAATEGSGTISATGSLADDAATAAAPTETTAPVKATPPARKQAVKKSRPRPTAKPAIKAVKPEGSIFEPLL